MFFQRICYKKCKDVTMISIKFIDLYRREFQLQIIKILLISTIFTINYIR